MATPNSNQDLARLGHEYPHEFISLVATDAAHTALVWLRAHNAPEQIISLIDSAVLLTMYAATAELDALTDAEAELLAEALPAASRLVVELGGVFHDAHGKHFPRKTTITWEPSKEANQTE